MKKRLYSTTASAVPEESSKMPLESLHQGRYIQWNLSTNNTILRPHIVVYRSMHFEIQTSKSVPRNGGVLTPECPTEISILSPMISVHRWRLFRRPIIADPKNVVLFTKAAIALHNYLRTEESGIYCPPGFVDGEDGSGNIISGSWRDEEPSTGLQPVGAVGGNRYAANKHPVYTCTCIFRDDVYTHSRYTRSAGDVRDQFADYFTSRAGGVNWQYAHVRRT